MRPLLGLVLVLGLAGCATSGPPIYIGKTGEQVLRSVPKDKSVIEYNVAGLLKVGNPIEAVTEQDQWRVVTACANDGQLILGMVRDSAYKGEVKYKAEQKEYKQLLAAQCS
jgi:SH3-like domain-containing protein